MPHVEVQHSNLLIDFRQLLLAINTALVQNHPDVFPSPQAIKARAVNIGEDYAIGIDPEEQSELKFIHTSLRILSGATEEKRAALSKTLANVISSFLEENLDYNGKNVQITVEIGEILGKTFQKVVLEGRF